ncbi:MAG: glycosyltransferase family 2 protein [Candidatus Paceibacterota bacterium]|jgi:hypothetical protein
MPKNLLVSIIIPAHNAENYIRRAIESALNQTYKNIEIFVIDDGSTDNTAKIIKSYKDPRIIYLYQENGGQGKARNYAISKSTGKYITFLDADDIYLPEKVEQEAKFLIANPKYKIAYCDMLHFYADKPDKFFRKKYQYYSGDILENLLDSVFLNLSTVMISRELWNNVIKSLSERRYYSEDWEMFLKIAVSGFLFGYVNKDLVKVEVRRDSITRLENQWIVKENAIEIFKKILPQIPKGKFDSKQIKKIIKKMEFKLAIAYLVVGKKKEFYKIFIYLLNQPFRIFLQIPAIALIATPSFILEPLLKKVWLLNQIRNSQNEE